MMGDLKLHIDYIDECLRSILTKLQEAKKRGYTHLRVRSLESEFLLLAESKIDWDYKQDNGESTPAFRDAIFTR